MPTQILGDNADFDLDVIGGVAWCFPGGDVMAGYPLEDSASHVNVDIYPLSHQSTSSSSNMSSNSSRRQYLSMH